jgi:hypothetical protein
MALARISLAMRRSGSVENKLDKMACNTFGLTPVASTRQTKPNSREAINSMFRWYRNATRCYVYLSDVSSPSFDTNEECNPRPWESDFRKSRWFTRGWTLQELLAPASVEFFSRERKRLGDKSSLKQQIHEITGIPDSALQGALYLSSASMSDSHG